MQSATPKPDTDTASSPNIGSTPIESVVGGIYGNAKKSVDKFQSDTDSVIQRMHERPMPPPPEMVAPPKQADYERPPMESFGTAAGFLATFGSLLTKRPLTTALKSSSNVMQAYQAQDARAFKSAMAEWKTDTDNAWKMADYNQKLYKDVIGKDESELRMRALAVKDDLMLHMADAKMAQQLYRDRERNLRKAKEESSYVMDHAQAAYDDAKEQGLSEDEAQMEYLKAMGEASNAKKGKHTESIDDDTADLLADRLLAGDKSALAGIGYGTAASASRKKVMDLYAKKARELGMSGEELANKTAEFAGTTAATRETAKRAANISLYANEAKKMGDIAREASAAVPRSQFMPFNKLQLEVQQGSGSTEVAQLVAATNSFVNTYTKAIQGTGTPTDTARSHGYEMLNNAQSPEQYAAVIDILNKEMQAAIDAPEEVKKQLLGRGKKESNGGKDARPSATGGKKQPSNAHIQKLKSDSSAEMRAYFDEAYGEGAAARILGGE